MTEQRQHRRFPVSVGVEILGSREAVAASTRDLSAGGLSLLAPVPLPEGRTLHLSIFLTHDGIEDPDEEPLDCQAQVRWSAANDDGKTVAGLQFQGLAPVQADQLARFLRRLAEG